MELSEKIKVLQDLNEDSLRETVLIPLFSKMGFIDPIIHHHSNEKGKDIICKEYDNKFHKTNYLAAVVKAGDVTGSASGNSNYFTLINQVKQSLNEPYKDIYEIKEINVDQVIIVISGKFLPTSLESIYGTLKAERLDKAIREPIDINKLVNLINEHFSEYWNELKDTKDSIRVQRDNLLNNFSKVSKLIFTDEKQEKIFLSQAASLEMDLKLFPFEFTRKYIADIGYKSIDIDEIDESFADSNIHNGYCDIKKYFFELKKKAQKILYDLDEPIEILKKILEEKNPEKMVDLTEDLESYIGYNGHIYVRADDITRQEEFGYAVKLHKDKKELLIKSGILEFYDIITSAIFDEAVKQLTLYFQQHANIQKDKWLKMVIKLSLLTKTITHLKFNIYTATPIELPDSFGSKRKEIKKHYIQNENEFVVEFVPNYFGFWKGEESSEQKAKSFAEHYRIEFEKIFFGYLGLEVE